MTEPITEPRFGSLVASPKVDRATPVKAERSERPARRDDARDARSATIAVARPPRTTDGDGSVKFFNSGRGYGFITPDGGGATVTAGGR